MERERLQNYVGNGEKAVPTFSQAEMDRRLSEIRGHMAEAKIDAALFSRASSISVTTSSFGLRGPCSP